LTVARKTRFDEQEREISKMETTYYVNNMAAQR